MVSRNGNFFFLFQGFGRNTIPWPFFAYRKDWSRVGVATLPKIGQDWGKRLEKGLAKDWMFFFSTFLARSSLVFDHR